SPNRSDSGMEAYLNKTSEWSRRRGSNPHGTKYHWILSPARLPVPPLRVFANSLIFIRCAFRIVSRKHSVRLAAGNFSSRLLRDPMANHILHSRAPKIMEQ